MKKRMVCMQTWRRNGKRIEKSDAYSSASLLSYSPHTAFVSPASAGVAKKRHRKIAALYQRGEKNIKRSKQKRGVVAAIIIK